MSSPTNQVHNYRIWQVITASAVGTMIEWYDFYIFGSLAVTISPLFRAAVTSLPPPPTEKRPRERELRWRESSGGEKAQVERS